MKKFILCFIYCIVQMFLCWGNFVYSQDVQVIDNDTFTTQESKTNTVSDLLNKIKELQARDNVWLGRIQDDTTQIQAYQAIIDQGAIAGVADAVPLASDRAKAIINPQPEPPAPATPPLDPQGTINQTSL